MALELVYIDGVLARAGTRGDGAKGEDVTHNARAMRSIRRLLDMNPPARIDVRGEVIFDLKGFNKMNREALVSGGKTYDVPRNAAAGLLRQRDPNQVRQRPLTFVAHGVGSSSEAWLTHKTLSTQFSAWGFHTAPMREAKTVSEMFERVEEIGLSRPTYPVEIDGAVVKLDHSLSRGSRQPNKIP